MLATASLLRLLALARPFVGLASGKEHSSRVDLCPYGRELCDLESYSGLLPVKSGGSLFYWYFVPPNLTKEAPLILWLQGGPGASSMVGNFFEMGPVTLEKHAKLQRRSADETWASEFPLLFVDSPVGAGFSQVGEGGYAKTPGAIAEDLVSFLDAFVSLHKHAPKQLVVAGESYAGHFVPALACAVHSNPSSKLIVKATIIGNSFLDPQSQVLTMPKQAFLFGLIDEEKLKNAEELALLSYRAAASRRFELAAWYRRSLENFISNQSHRNLMDIRTGEGYGFMSVRMNQFFGLNTTKSTLHVPRHLEFGKDAEVLRALVPDIMRSQTAHIETLLSLGIRVLLFQGEFDLKDSVASNEAWISALPWARARNYAGRARAIWRRAVDDQVAGSWHLCDNLEEVVVLGGGHMATMDQPRSALDMVQRFIWQRQPQPVEWVTPPDSILT